MDNSGSSPPEIFSGKKISLSVLSEAEGCIDLLQVWGEAEAGELFGVTFLQLIRFVDPYLIAWMRKENTFYRNITNK